MRVPRRDLFAGFFSLGGRFSGFAHVRFSGLRGSGGNGVFDNLFGFRDNLFGFGFWFGDYCSGTGSGRGSQEVSRSLVRPGS